MRRQSQQMIACKLSELRQPESPNLPTKRTKNPVLSRSVLLHSNLAICLLLILLIVVPNVAVVKVTNNLNFTTMKPVVSHTLLDAIALPKTLSAQGVGPLGMCHLPLNVPKALGTPSPANQK